MIWDSCCCTQHDLPLEHISKAVAMQLPLCSKDMNLRPCLPYTEGQGCMGGVLCSTSQQPCCALLYVNQASPH